MKSQPRLGFPRRQLPPMAHVTRRLPREHIEHPDQEVCRQLLDRGLAKRVRQGARIAITAGSRGIGALVPILSGIATAVKQCGGEPFIVPAMGSHGGATPEGQTEILRLLGVNDGAAGMPIRSTMETIELGMAANGAMAHLDRYAAEADGIIVLGRTQIHPESAEGLASGLLKMVTIGLGKQRGAQQAHSHKLWDSVRHVPEVVLPKSKIVFGIAVVENGYRQPLKMEVVDPNYEAFLESDKRLLELAKQHAAKLPFGNLDLLIVDEMGKTISGSGMDLNVIGTYRATGKGPHEPDIKRIVALSLTEASLGNALGIGLADFTTQRLLDAWDPGVSYINLLTAMEPESTTHEGPFPLALPTDREAIEVGLYSAIAGEHPRVCRIKSTARLDDMWVSDALLTDAEMDPSIDVDGAATEMSFSAAGNLF